MKHPYPDVLITKENGYKIQIRKYSLYFVVKIGKEGMKNYQKKAHSENCNDQESLKKHLQKICSLNSIDYVSLENRLNKALKPKKQVKVLKLSDTWVGNGGIHQYMESSISAETYKLLNTPKLKITINEKK